MLAKMKGGKQQGLEMAGTFHDNCINSGELTGQNFGGGAKSCCRDTLERQRMWHTVVELLEKENVIRRICIFPTFLFLFFFPLILKKKVENKTSFL